MGSSECYWVTALANVGVFLMLRSLKRSPTKYGVGTGAIGDLPFLWADWSTFSFPLRLHAEIFSPGEANPSCETFLERRLLNWKWVGDCSNCKVFNFVVDLFRNFSCFSAVLLTGLYRLCFECWRCRGVPKQILVFSLGVLSPGKGDGPFSGISCLTTEEERLCVLPNFRG